MTTKRKAQFQLESKASCGKAGRKTASAGGLFNPANNRSDPTPDYAMKTKQNKLTQAQSEAELAQLKARQANHWCRLLENKVSKLTFPSLTQGTVTPAKKLAGIMRLIRREDPGFPPCNLTDQKILVFLGELSRDTGRGDKKSMGRLTQLAHLCLHLERAVVDGDKQFLADYRKAMSSYMKMSDWRKIYSWMMSNHKKVEACHSPAQIWRLVKDKFFLRDTDRSNFHRTLREINFPVSAPPINRKR